MLERQENRCCRQRKSNQAVSGREERRRRNMKHMFRTWFLSVTSIAALLALAAATFAWFTSNRAVSTSVATARSGEETLELQISSRGGSGFQSMDTAAIQQVNQTSATYLMPVSTADLVNFVYVPLTVNGNASTFEAVKEEKYYYHGRVYLRAQGTGWPQGTKMNLYLDQTDGLLGTNSDGKMLSAARLGLMFDGDASTAAILRLTEEELSSSKQAYNTVINGKTLGKNQVLSSKNNNVQAVTDPSVSVADYTISFGNEDVQVPSRPLLSMELNKVYTVDVYFYLEGCDPDCSDAIDFQQADLHLAFYGMVEEVTG